MMRSELTRQSALAYRNLRTHRTMHEAFVPYAKLAVEAERTTRKHVVTVAVICCICGLIAMWAKGWL